MNIVKRVTYAYAVASVAELTWFDDPYIFVFIGSIFLHLLYLLMIVQKSLILWILNSFDDMKGQGDGSEDITSNERIIFLHIIEQSFLIAYKIVMFEMVTHDLFLCVVNSDYIFLDEKVDSFDVGSLD